MLAQGHKHPRPTSQCRPKRNKLLARCCLLLGHRLRLWLSEHIAGQGYSVSQNAINDKTYRPI